MASHMPVSPVDVGPRRALDWRRERGSSSRKAELQGNMLEAKWLVLLVKNARLGLQVAVAKEEARGLVTEVGYMWRRAGELVHCVVKLQEDHRVCLLGRRIQVLQALIYALECPNHEYYETMVQRELEKSEARLELDRIKAKNQRLRNEATAVVARRKEKKGDDVARW